MIVYKVASGFPVNLTADLNESDGLLKSDIVITTDRDYELHRETKYFSTLEERKQYIAGLMEGFYIAMR